MQWFIHKLLSYTIILLSNYGTSFSKRICIQRTVTMASIIFSMKIIYHALQERQQFLKQNYLRNRFSGKYGNTCISFQFVLVGRSGILNWCSQNLFLSILHWNRTLPDGLLIFVDIKIYELLNTYIFLFK